MSDPFVQDLAEIKAAGLFQPLPLLEGPQGPSVVMRGKKVINLSSNNYLGLATHPRLVEAMVAATEQWGAGSGAVRTIIGTQPLHLQLEERLAAFKGTEAALVFQSGFTCNTGVIPIIAGADDVILSDELNHASIIDGCRLSRAKTVRYAHVDLADLAEKLALWRPQARRLIIITDGVFSMDGNIAPLPEIVALAEQYDALVYVDDAHSSGVLGERGQGSVHHFGLGDRVAIQVGTLSKAIGVVGGYVAGCRSLIDLLIQRGRPFLFSTSHPPGVAAANLAAIELLDSAEGEALIAQLWANARYFKQGLVDLGFNTGASETPITPVLAGDGPKAIELSSRLFEAGVFCSPIAFPMVAHEKSRVRTIVTAEHTREQLDFALAAFAQVGKALGLI